MKGIIKKSEILVIAIIVTFIISGFFYFSDISRVEAKSGCCSHHGGVCGCRCCDGTPLSAKCAPYYPQCNTNTIPAQKDEPPAPKYDPPVKEESPIPQNDLPAVKKYTADVPEENIEGSFWWWAMGIGIAGYIFYKLKKRK